MLATRMSDVRSAHDMLLSLSSGKTKPVKKKERVFGDQLLVP